MKVAVWGILIFIFLFISRIWSITKEYKQYCKAINQAAETEQFILYSRDEIRFFELYKDELSRIKTYYIISALFLILPCIFFIDTFYFIVIIILFEVFINNEARFYILETQNKLLLEKLEDIKECL